MNKYYLYILLAIFLCSCASPGQQDQIKQKQSSDKSKTDIKQPDKVWQCRDYVYDDHIALELTKTNITVGDVMMHIIDESSNESDSPIKEIEKDPDAREALNKLKEVYAGSIRLSGEEPEGAIYYRQGLNHRWEWGDGYVFILKPSNRGYYYDFSNSKEGELISPNGSFKCERA